MLATELLQAVDRGESYTFHGLRPVDGVEAEALASWLTEYAERVRMAIN